MSYHSLIFDFSNLLTSYQSWFFLVMARPKAAPMKGKRVKPSRGSQSAIWMQCQIKWLTNFIRCKSDVIVIRFSCLHSYVTYSVSNSRISWVATRLELNNRAKLKVSILENVFSQNSKSTKFKAGNSIIIINSSCSINNFRVFLHQWHRWRSGTSPPLGFHVSWRIVNFYMIFSSIQKLLKVLKIYPKVFI